MCVSYQQTSVLSALLVWMCLKPTHTRESRRMKEMHKTTFHVFINMIGTWCSCFPRKYFVFNYQTLCLEQDEACVQLWIGQLLIVSWMGGPTRLQCQPYWLSLIPQHSVFVYGASENLTTCGTPGGESVAVWARIVTISYPRTQFGAFLCCVCEPT